MAEELAGLNVAFHFESDDATGDVGKSAGLIAEGLSALPAVTDVNAQAGGPDRFIDPVTVTAVLVTLRVIVNQSANLVDSLDHLVNSVKKLGLDLGFKHVWIELHRKRVDLNDITPEQLQELAVRVRDVRT